MFINTLLFFLNMITQTRSKRKSTGGRYHKLYRKKKLYEAGRETYLAKVDETKAKTVEGRSKYTKRTLLSVNYANVADPKTKKIKKVLIKSVVDNTANRNYIRRNIVTKGAVIETDMGKAKVTSRPGQEGNVNAVLIQE